MKGVFETRKPKPKYDDIWDVSQVLTYLSMLHPVQELPLKDLTLKVLVSTVTSHWPEGTIDPFNEPFCYEAYRISMSIPNT